MMGATTLARLAELVDGQLVGDGDVVIHGAATLDTATGNDITFANHPSLASQLEASQAAAVLVSLEFGPLDRPAIRVANVRDAFARIVSHFRPPFQLPARGISPAAHVDPTAQLGEQVNIHPGAVIGPEVQIGNRVTIHANVCVMGRCRIGDDVTLFPNVVLYEDTILESRVTIHAGAVIGAYGFGYETSGGRHHRSAQLGYVHLHADVEIGANTTIDRGTYGPTVVEEGTKIDNQVMIAHNCRLGRHNLICSQVGIAGSSTTGDYVVMAGQVGVPDHVKVGHRAVLGAKAGIMRDVPPDTTVIGIPATPERDQMAKQAAFARLPEMRKQLRALQKTVDALVQQQTENDEQVHQTDAA